MKRIFLFFAMVMMFILTMAQAPQKMNFQALVRNSANELVTNQTISIEISVLNGSNTAVYTETQTVTTNANGVATLVIGEGTATKGTFAGIDWSAGNYYLQTTANLGGGASAIVGTTPLLSVPYALYAEKAGNAEVDLSEYAKKTDLPEEVDLNAYAKTSDLPDMSGYYSKAEIDALLAALESKIAEGGNSGSDKTGDFTIENGAIKAAFSVSAEKQVYFSQGNLQYQASTNTWRFAENQYDMIGADNSNISSTYSGYIDLFGWGTSGYNGKNPYMTSTSYSDYGVVGDAYADIAGTNYDWGVYNKISNGGNTAGQWRTLTYEEWNYVLSERTDASALKGSATVNGVTGMILLPDNWTTPSDITFTNGMNGFSNNTYTTSDWAKMEANGAVFLPTAGSRGGSDVNLVGSGGYYWSSSAGSSDSAYCLDFSSDGAYMYYYYRYGGQSVRLVREVNSNTDSGDTGNQETGGQGESGNEESGSGETGDEDSGNDNNDEGNTSILENGAIKAAFSVSDSKQVYFSQGNLQYQASTNTWRFAEHQYDMIGNDNAKISSSYSGYIDLFGWGTSGYNGKNPYMTSKNDSDYGVVGDDYADIAGTNYDWGVYNAISNGGGTAGMWRTLIYGEWSYVLSKRTDASALKGLATVNGVTGMILLPDNWTTPEGITFTSGVNGFSNNTYTTSDWVKMEANGAVFLPTAGFRDGSDVYGVGSYGFYWSSYALYDAYCLGFNSDDAYMCSNDRYYGRSVRLVREVNSNTDSGDTGNQETGGQGESGNEESGSGETGDEDSGNDNNDEGNTSILENGAIKAAFSVSDSKQVNFSMGNLQYQASTNTWRFAENQYDIIGKNNSNISSTYSGWIDLFGWGTSGYNGKNPYMTSTSCSDYGVVGDINVDIAGTNYDWGVYNKISNGGNTAGQWRTLSENEWYYVLSERTDASSLKGLATVNGVTGLILLPDNWTTPEGITFTSGVNGYDSNTYTTSDWAKMEANGAVFLPAAGYRSGSAVSSVGTLGYYWSSSAVFASDYGLAYYLFFNRRADAYMNYDYIRYYGLSVRLVREVNSNTDSGDTGNQETGGQGESGNEESGSGETGDEDSGNDNNDEGNTSILENGAIKAAFSVSDSKQVNFSMGNLQYKASTNTWRFAENQYDIIGDNNSNISSTYSDYIDLFGWGTSGYNNINPYSKFDYAFSCEHKHIAGTNYDWGVYNAISNGGNAAGMWRTLTNEEWIYVLSQRTNASSLRSYATVNGVSGIILLPDNWTTPDGITFYRGWDDVFANNSYTTSDWAKMEANGAVFLPAAGNRSGSGVGQVGSYGWYWSSSAYYNDAVCLRFDSYYADVNYYCDRYDGQSVRLVRDLIK